MSELLDIFKALADEGRLRILRAIDQAELSVAELVQALEMPQSSVSRHLKPLREAGLVASRRDGTSVYYNRGSVFLDECFFKMFNDRLGKMPFAQRDSGAVERVLELRRNRSQTFFDEIAGQYESLTEPGGGWQALAAGLACGFAGQSVADLGCGEGTLTLLLARFVKQVLAIDQSEKMLKLVEEKAAEQEVLERVTLKQASLEMLQLPKASLDVVFLSQSLHHTTTPEQVIKNAAAGLKPSGKLVILDLVRHEHEWTREQWADQWLGFDGLQLRAWLGEAGVKQCVLRALPGAAPDLAVLMVVGTKD